MPHTIPSDNALRKAAWVLIKNKGVHLKVKNLIINRPAFYLSESNYCRYVILLSKFLSISGETYSLKCIEQNSSSVVDQIVWKIEGIDIPIIIQSQYRISRFLKGFSHAGKRQWDRYGLSDLIGVQAPDVLIDIGANIGEVSFFASRAGISRVIAIDPDPIAGECLQFNLRDTDVEIDLRAIGEKNGRVSFYSKAQSADSSFFKPEGKYFLVDVESLTLDKFFCEKGVSGNVLLKMDAEGFEPEILRSGLVAIQNIKWVAIDASAERGRETTVEEVVRILNNSGFQFISVSHSNIVTASRN